MAIYVGLTLCYEQLDYVTYDNASWWPLEALEQLFYSWPSLLFLIPKETRTKC